MSKVDFKNHIKNPVYPNVNDVLPDELNTYKDNIQLIDVRRDDEFSGELGHIPGAILITLDTLPEKIIQLDKSRTTVFVCRSGSRSAQASQFAYELGWTDVYNMKGGMIAWNNLGYTTER
jgi:hydroxyacylglutathione hydrolase